MKRYSRPAWSIMLSLIVALLVTSTGCNKEAWVASNAASFGLGYLLGRSSAPTVTETQCFENGLEVDCSTLP